MNSTSVHVVTGDTGMSLISTTEEYDDSSRAEMITRYFSTRENMEIISFYALITQCVIGLIGNSASLAIWVAGKRSSVLAPSTYFKFLSATDVFSLIYRLMDALGRWPVEASFMDSDVMCFIDLFLFFFAPQLSTWIVVCLTIERTLSLCFPLKFHTKGSGRRAKIAFVVILLILTSVNCIRPMLCTSDSSLLRDIYTEVMKLSGIHLLCVIPLVAITTCNVVVICKLCTQKKIGASDSRRHVVSKFTRISIGAGILQCVSIIPALIYHIEVFHIVRLLQLKYEEQPIFQYICDIVLYLNNTFNFVVYSFSSRDFRMDFREMFCCKH